MRQIRNSKVDPTDPAALAAVAACREQATAAWLTANLDESFGFGTVRWRGDGWQGILCRERDGSGFHLAANGRAIMAISVSDGLMSDPAMSAADYCRQVAATIALMDLSQAEPVSAEL